MKEIRADSKPVLMNAQAAADYLGVSYWLITDLARKKKIPFVPVGSRPHFRKETLDQWVVDQEKASLEPERNRFGIQRIKE